MPSFDAASDLASSVVNTATQNPMLAGALAIGAVTVGAASYATRTQPGSDVKSTDSTVNHNLVSEVDK